MVHITLLGGQTVVDPVTERILTRSTRSLALVAFLVLHTGAPQSRSVIAGAFWPESSERQALTNLRRELHELRGLLGDGSTLEVTSSHLCWHDDDLHRVDLGRFLREASATVAATGDDDALRHGTLALAAHTGVLLPAMDDAWLEEARAGLRRRCADVCDIVCAAAQRSRRLDVAADALHQRLSVDAYDEPTYRRLMEVQAAAGDRAGAVRTYHRLSGLLELDLGLEPDPLTTATLERLTREPHVDQAEDPTPVMLERPGPARVPLVGRELELRAIAAAWRRSRRGQAGVLLVRGEAGVGKSRLVHELETHVRRGHGVVATGRCFDSGGRLPLAPVSDWLRSPAVADARGRLEAAWQHEVERLVPAVVDGDRSGPVDGRAKGPVEPHGEDRGEVWQRQRFYEGVARALLAPRRPTLLILDNLQWCDPDTLTVVTVLLNLDLRAPLLVVVTARPEIEHANAAAASWLAGLRRERRLEELDLGPFDVSQTAELASSVTGARTTAPQASLLHVATGGFPLFVVEAARASLRTGRLDGDAALSAILTGRLRLASVEAREVAALAAAVGQHFPLQLLAEASNLEPDVVVSAVDELWRARILRQLGDGYDFSHDLLRDAAYALVAPARRWLLHRRLAGALEELASGHPETVFAQLAAQNRLAGNHELAQSYYVRAAQATVDVFAHAEALLLLDDALREIDALPPGRHRDESEMSCRIMASRIAITVHGFTAPGLDDDSARIIALAERLNRHEEHITAMVNVWGACFVRGDVRSSADLAERIVGLVSPGDPMYGQAHFTLGGAALHTGRCQASFDAFEVARAAFAGDEFVNFHSLASSYVDGWWAHAAWAVALPERAGALASGALAEARSSGHIHSIVVALAYGALTHELLGDVESCLRYADEAVALAERYRVGYFGDWGRVLAGWCRGAAGVAETERGIAGLRRLGALARMPHWLALLAERTPVPDRAAALLAEAVTCAVEHEETFWLPDLWLRQAAFLEEPEAMALCARAGSLAREQGNLSMLERCRSSLTSVTRLAR